MKRKSSLVIVVLSLLLIWGPGLAEAKSKVKPKPTPTKTEKVSKPAKAKSKAKSTPAKAAKSFKPARRGSYLHHFSESNFNPLNSITFDPVGLAFGLANLEYQRLITPTSALAGRLLLGYGFGVGGSYRFYLLDNVSPQEGLWVGPGLDLYGFSYSYGGETASGFFVTPRAEGGYRLLFQVSDRIALVLAPSLALGFTIGSVSVGGSTFGGGVYFGLGIGLGMAF